MKYAISVVIPAFNEAELLPQCLDSINNQDYDGNFEIIVVDNASTDATAGIAAGLGAGVVFCEKRGVAYARHTGALAASGEIIVQADADTIYPADWLNKIASRFAANPDIAALAGVYEYQNRPRWAKLEYIARYWLNLAGLLILRRPVAISGANFAFRRKAFLQTGGYNPDAAYPDQWGISTSLSRAGRIAYMRTLKVFTSTRRIQKPFLSLLFDALLNSLKLLNRFIRHNLKLLKASASEQAAEQPHFPKTSPGNRLEKVLSK